MRDELNISKKRQNEITFFTEKMLKLFLIFFVLTVSFSVSASFILNRMLNRGLMKLSIGAHEISSGNYDHHFENIMNDEIGSVMRDFNQMAGQLQIKTGELRQANTQLRESSKHKDRFLANMSHELRTPLNSVVGFSELLIERGEGMPPEKVQRYGQRILSASEHLLSLISDLLDVVKIDAGVLNLEKTEFNLSTCCIEVCHMLEPVVQKRGLEFINTIDPNLSIIADQRLVRQILINLFNNATKFTNEGRVEVTLEGLRDEYKIEVKDTGIGISEDDQVKVFDDFHRVESGMTANYEGVGIGLTLTKRLVELHKGRISLVSTLNKGSIFTVVLPKGKQK